MSYKLLDMVSLELGNHRLQYSNSPAADSESNSPSDSLTLEISPATSDKHFYFPSGLLASNQGTFFDTDEDVSATGTPKARHLSGDDLQRLVPEGDKVISYEATSPTSERNLYGKFLTRNAEGFGDSSSDDSRRPIVIQGVSVSSPEMFEEFYPSKKQKTLSKTQDLSRTIALEHELERLKLKLEANTSELSRVREVIDRNQDDKETYTLDEDDELERCNEIIDLRKECLRYERQNEELRTELQYSAQDLSESEHTIRKLNQDLSLLTEKTETYETEMKHCIRLIGEMLSPNYASSLDESDDLHHLSNFLSSKVEIAKSRLGRLKTKYELSTSEVKRLQADNEKYRRLMKTLAAEHSETTAMLRKQLKASELKVIQLEQQLALGQKPQAASEASTVRKAATSIRIPGQSELETYIEKIKEGNARRSSQSAITNSPGSFSSTHPQEDLSSKSDSFNESTREPCTLPKHTKVISFTDDLEGDKEQPKPGAPISSVSPDRKKPTAKVLPKYTLNERGVASRFITFKAGVRRVPK